MVGCLGKRHGDDEDYVEVRAVQLDALFGSSKRGLKVLEGKGAGMAKSSHRRCSICRVAKQKAIRTKDLEIQEISKEELKEMLRERLEREMVGERYRCPR